jgi:hypothetical protein
MERNRKFGLVEREENKLVKELANMRTDRVLICKVSLTEFGWDFLRGVGERLTLSPQSLFASIGNNLQ